MSQTILYERQRYLGLAIGSLWLILVGGVYGAWALIVARTTAATSVLIAWCAVTIALLALAIVTMRRVHQLPPEPPRPALRRRILWQFGTTVVVEVIGIVVVVVACERAHHWLWTIPLILIVVGLHFVPLAGIFRVPRYYAMAAFFCVLPVATMLYWPSSAHVGHAYTWILAPAIGCGLVALLTGWAGIHEARQSVLRFRQLAV